jgi:PAS domain S-box-containing protein
MKKIYNIFSPVMDKKPRWILAFSLAAFVFFFLVMMQQQKKQESSQLLINHTNQVIKKLDSLGLLLAEAESAARSYLVTNNQDWKNQTYLLHTLVTQSINDLQKLTADNPAQQTNVTILKDLCVQKEIFHVKMLTGKVSLAELPEKIAPNGEGPSLSRAIKSILNKIRSVEEELLSGRMLQNTVSNRIGSYIAFSAGVFALLLVLVILSQLSQDISLRKKAEKDVVLSEEKYRALIENAGVVMFTSDLTGAISFANKSVADLTGYSVEELIGKSFTILVDAGWMQKVSEFYVDQFVTRTPATTLEFLINTKSGTKKWVEQSAQLLYSEDRIIGFQCMVKDISERKLVEEELGKSEIARKENEYRLNAIMDNSTALIYIKDTKGHYLMANKKFKNFFGLSDEILIGQTDYDFNTKELADHFMETDEHVINTRKPIETVEVIETHFGKRNLLLLKFPLLTPDGALFGVSGIATDVTEKVEMQRQTTDALKKAETAQQIQEQFLANMSHEIRTPMNGIQGMTKLLLETKLSEEQKKYASIITRSLNDLVVIVNNVLDFSNLKRGKLVLDNIVFDLTETLKEIDKYFEHQVASKKLVFKLQIDGNVPQHVKGDPYRLKQLLSNLLRNAIKFTDKGEIVLHVSVGIKNNDRIPVIFTLSDTGIGIEKDKLETIFESFAQGGKKISSGYGGAGLGLTISKGLIELQGGSISVQSSLGAGSVFTFSIPFDRVQKEEVTAIQNDYTNLLAGKRILVVEDNTVNQRLIDFVLKKMDINADLAGNGKEAIALCEKNPPYDLIIMDLQMPVMDGYETTIYLRKTMKLTIPIIAMTATVLKEDQERCAEVGMNDFMIKPFDFNDLYSRLSRLLLQVEITGDGQKKEEPAEALFDLSLLKELDDADSILEVLSIFLENATEDVAKLEKLVQENKQTEIGRMAHKLKGAVAAIQAKKLTELCKAIEQNGLKGENIPETREMVAELAALFAAIKEPLREEMERIRKEAGINN